MTVAIIVDVGLAILVLFVAGWIVVVRSTFAAVIGFGTAAKWLFIVAVILLIVGAVGALMGRSRT